MYRIRFHGRGGQGMKTASRILGTAFFLSGYEVQDAPRYGAERRVVDDGDRLDGVHTRSTTSSVWNSAALIRSRICIPNPISAIGTRTSKTNWKTSCTRWCAAAKLISLPFSRKSPPIGLRHISSILVSLDT